jgi:hypothetical protein
MQDHSFSALPVHNQFFQYDADMPQQPQELAVQSPPIKANRGWFRAGDRRINLQGRPHGKKAHGAPTGAIASSPDRVMRVFVADRVLRSCLTQSKAPWIVNLPGDFQIVGSYHDATRGGMYLIIRSSMYNRVARGSIIPSFDAYYNGLIWCQ